MTNMAFDAIDTDKSGEIEKDELKETLIEIAKEIGIPVPSENDVLIVLYELDQDGDDKVNRDEFEYMLVKVLEKMAETEMEINKKIDQAKLN